MALTDTAVRNAKPALQRPPLSIGRFFVSGIQDTTRSPVLICMYHAVVVGCPA